jgi:DNA-binding Lrp family transcriptional regulator
MTQAERDRLVTLKKAKKKLITQRQAAEETKLSERHIRRLVKRLKKDGDRAVIHGLKGKPSNRQLEAKMRDRIVGILSEDRYRGFGPTLASEYLREKHEIQIGREALRKVMSQAGLWRPRKQKREKPHVWRERKERFGELVQWDSSDHDWLEGRGPRLYLVHMIDDATSRLMARFVLHDSTEENMRLLWAWVERYGRPLAFYTDKDSMFHNCPRRVDGEEMKDMPPTQIERALQELQIASIKAHSPQAKGRVERSFQTAQDRLVKGMRVSGVRTLEEANKYLAEKFLPWWERHCTVAAAHPDDAHRPLGRDHNLVSSISIVKFPKIDNDHTFRVEKAKYRVDKRDVKPGLRGSRIRFERRLDGTVAARFGSTYLRISQCVGGAAAESRAAPQNPKPPESRGKKPGHNWMQKFNLDNTPSWREIYRTGALNRL